MKGLSIGVPTVVFTVLFLGPLVYVVLLGFWRVENFSIVATFGLDNYLDIARNLFSGSNYGFSIAQTLYVAATTAILAVVLAYPMALAIVFTVPERYQRLVVLLAVAPFWTSYILRVFAWQVLLAKRGVINSALAFAGLRDIEISILYTQIRDSRRPDPLSRADPHRHPLCLDPQCRPGPDRGGATVRSDALADSSSRDPAVKPNSESS